MSWIDDIVDFGSGVLDFFTTNPIGSNLAKTAITGFTLNQVTKSINRDNEAAKSSTTTTPAEKDFGVREQVDPDTDHSVPVIYGDAYIGGIVTDAELTNSNQTMWYCLTLCERTGVKLSDGLASVITFQSVFWNQNRITFQSDGITVASFTDEDGVVDTNPAGLIKIYPFNAGSNAPVNFAGYASGNSATAQTLFPNWTSDHLMTDLVFALVRVDYNKEKSVTGLGRMEFKLSNSMTMPGDCLYDYATNTRYGAGITAEEINDQ